MFDVGFWELILIAIMGLVILGPDRLPVAIRTVRSWITGARKFSETVKTELTEELRVHELHANLKKAEETNLQQLSPEVAASLKTLQEAAASVSEPFKKVDTEPVNSMTSSSLASSPNTQVEDEQLEKLDNNVIYPADTTENLAAELENTVDKLDDKPQS